jgi:hypothetical protein
MARKLVNDGPIDFSCKSFLPLPDFWDLRDSRDGRILCSGNRPRQAGRCCGRHCDLGRPLAVCDPLHRRYLMLPAIPEELAALVDHGEDLDAYMAFLAPAAGEEDDGSTTPSFRVMCMAQSADKLVLFVFSSFQVGGGRQWCGINFDGWSGLCHDTDFEQYYPLITLVSPSYVRGRFYWPVFPGRKKLLVLDVRGSIPEFSTMDSPPHARESTMTLVEAVGEQESLAVVTVCRHKDHSAYHLRYDVLRGNDGDQWETEAIIYLSMRYRRYRCIGVAQGYLLLEGTPKRRKEMARLKNTACFSLDLRTLQLDWFCGSKYSFNGAVDFYAGCLSYLSPPTV